MYGLIGEHLTHSFSKEIHGKCAPYQYDLKELAPHELEKFMKAAEFKAVNVTIPYKQAVMAYLHEIHPHARRIGAVNTVVNRGGRLYGYNTDFYGMAGLIRHAGVDITGRKVLILGSGGTARTARAVAEALGAAEMIVVGRRAAEDVVTYDTAYTHHGDAEVLINTTPCGMYPYPDGTDGRSASPIDVSRFPQLVGVVDVVYNPIRTQLVQEALSRGIPAEGGLYMLVGQAVVASRVFLGDDIQWAGNDPQVIAAMDKVYESVLREKENIVLTGMPGSGKTTVGKELSHLLGRPFFDTDTLVEAAAGKSISCLFEELGEPGFRELESQAVREAANRTGCIIATGGGAILRDDNVRALRRTGRIYFLDRDVEALIPTEDRPLASTVEDIRRRYAERYDRYVATCHVQVVADGGVEDTVAKIRKEFGT